MTTTTTNTEHQLITKLTAVCETALIDIHELHDDAHGLDCTDCEMLEETIPMLEMVSTEARAYLTDFTLAKRAETSAGLLFRMWLRTKDTRHKKMLWRKYQAMQGWYTPRQDKAA